MFVIVNCGIVNKGKYARRTTSRVIKNTYYTWITNKNGATKFETAELAQSQLSHMGWCGGAPAKVESV